MPAAIAILPERNALPKDPLMPWLRGEFAAANAIIDALCVHLRRLDPSVPSRYEAVFRAVNRRRRSWIPLIHNQQHFSIAEIITELNKVAEEMTDSRSNGITKVNAVVETKGKEGGGGGGGGGDDDDHESGGGDQQVDEDVTSDVTDAGSQESQPLDHIALCSNHEECEARRSHINAKSRFAAMEQVNGQMVNVVKGLKLYEDVFTDQELSKLNDLVNELRVSGQNGELSGETFILYNQQTKRNRRELIQLGVPIFTQIKEGHTNKPREGCIEPIPLLLQAVVNHLCQWHLISENSKPNGCMINFFDEGEFSQPFLKPPHLDQPVSTLLLEECTMAFGHAFVNDRRGNYRGPLMLSFKKGSLLVMKGNSCSTARHAMSSSSNKRVSITFFRVRSDVGTDSSPTDKNHPSAAMPLGQPNVQNLYPAGNTCDVVPNWAGLVAGPPVFVLAPVVPPMVAAAPEAAHNGGGGTGVFLPRCVGTRKPARQLPPRARRLVQRLELNSPPPAVTCKKPEKDSADSEEIKER